MTDAEREALIRLGMDGWVSPQELSPLHQHLMFFRRLLDEARADYANLLNDTNGEIRQSRAESASRLAALNDTRERAAVEVAHLRDLQGDLMAQNKRAFDRNAELEREVARLTKLVSDDDGAKALIREGAELVRTNETVAQLRVRPGASTIDRLRDILSVIDTRDPDLRRLLAERNLFVVGSPGAPARERAWKILSTWGYASVDPLRDEIARALEQAEREARAAAIEMAAQIADRECARWPAPLHFPEGLTARSIAKAIRALVADNKKPAGAG